MKGKDAIGGPIVEPSNGIPLVEAGIDISTAVAATVARVGNMVGNVVYSAECKVTNLAITDWF